MNIKTMKERKDKNVAKDMFEGHTVKSTNPEQDYLFRDKSTIEMFK